MAYVAPNISVSGLHIPTYQDILDILIVDFKGIYGQDVYLGEDSADYELLSVFALRIYDCMQVVQLVYNNRSPQSAVGSALDTVVRFNGLKRKVASKSTATVTITGVAGTVINNGIVSDVSGRRWTLPVQVVIGGGGTVDTTATCEESGAIAALTGEITTITTPTAGWTSVTNAAPASLGQPVETHTQLRYRQSISAKGPSHTLLAGTISAIASVSGVTRHKVYENPTDAVDGNGLPRHSVTALVEGGADADIARVIHDKRGIGVTTNGTTTVNVTDTVSGVVSAIKFSRPGYTDIYNVLDIKALTGYTTQMGDLVKQAVVDYENGLQIGEDVTVSAIYAAAMAVMPDIKVPSFSLRAVKIGTAPAPGASNDIVIDFDKVARSEVAKVTINLV